MFYYNIVHYAAVCLYHNIISKLIVSPKSRTSGKTLAPHTGPGHSDVDGGVEDVDCETERKRKKLQKQKNCVCKCIF